MVPYHCVCAGRRLRRVFEVEEVCVAGDESVYAASLRAVLHGQRRRHDATRRRSSWSTIAERSGVAAKDAILLHDEGVGLETATKVKTMIDTTGMLTTGQISVAAVKLVGVGDKDAG